MKTKYMVRLSAEERRQLTALIRAGHAAASTIRHAHILLQADEHGPSWTDARIAERFAISVNTVLRVRQRWVTQGLEAALTRKQRDRPPSPRTPRLDGEGVARLLALRGSAPPAGHARWTLRLLADQAVAVHIVEAMSYETVRQVLKKHMGTVSAAEGEPATRVPYAPAGVQPGPGCPWSRGAISRHPPVAQGLGLPPRAP